MEKLINYTLDSTIYNYSLNNALQERNKYFENYNRTKYLSDLLLKNTNLCKDINSIILQYEHTDKEYIPSNNWIEFLYKHYYTIYFDIIKYHIPKQLFKYNNLNSKSKSKIVNKILSKIKKIMFYNNIYPIETDNIELLIIQKCIFNLKKNGIIQLIIQSDFLTNNKYIEIKKWLVNKINIIEIVENKIIQSLNFYIKIYSLY